MVTKEMYGEWKRNKVTQEFVRELQEFVESQVAAMIRRSHPDEAADQLCRAVVRVADELLSWEPEFTKEAE